jgi:hypothetical protein
MELSVGGRIPNDACANADNSEGAVDAAEGFTGSVFDGVSRDLEVKTSALFSDERPNRPGA